MKTIKLDKKRGSGEWVIICPYNTPMGKGYLVRADRELSESETAQGLRPQCAVLAKWVVG